MPNSAASPATSFISARRLLSVVLVMLLSLAISGSYLVYQAQQDARSYTLKQGQQALRQYAVLLQPLLLGDDRVSMNYLLGELVRQPQVNALTIRSADGEILARAGESRGLTRHLELEREGELLGKITLWLNTEPAYQLLRRQLLHTLGLALSLVLAVVITLRHKNRKAHTPAEALQPEATQTAPRFEQLLELQQQPQPVEIDPLDEALQETELPLEEEVQPEPAQPQPAPAFQPDPLMAEPPLAEPVDQSDHSDEEVPSDSNEDLISLLRPDKTERMPRFTPSGNPDDDDDIPLLTDTFGPAQTPEPEPAASLFTAQEPPARANPLTAASPRGYSIDDELDLVVSPENAAYMLLIDSTSGHAEYVEEEERSALLAEYRQLAEQCAHIYKGELQELKSGDLQLRFFTASARDEHGINALCAATLFTLAYKQFNQNRIRSFEPVLNLHMALVRGRQGDPDLLHEEACHLAHTTQSNALISHTALTEAPHLKRSLLKDADVRREDEDKVLIQALNERYQSLLERQAGHLLQPE